MLDLLQQAYALFINYTPHVVRMLIAQLLIGYVVLYTFKAFGLTH